MHEAKMLTTQQSSTKPSTKQDILGYLLKQTQATAQELSDYLQVTPQAIRRHLKDLETEGLIVHQAVQVGMGRPQHVYELSPQGRDRFPDRYDDFAISLLNTLAETVGRDQVGSILQKQWERKALEYREQLGTGSLPERIAKLVELRRAEGYMAEWYRVERESNRELDGKSDGESHEKAETETSPLRFIVTEYHCAISHIAESFPTICGHELEMFAVALQDCKVERTHWLANGEHRCGYLIQSKTQS